jgi:hypothetical protein
MAFLSDPERARMRRVLVAPRRRVFGILIVLGVPGIALLAALGYVFWAVLLGVGTAYALVRNRLDARWIEADVASGDLNTFVVAVHAVPRADSDRKWLEVERGVIRFDAVDASEVRRCFERGGRYAFRCLAKSGYVVTIEPQDLG